MPRAYAPLPPIDKLREFFDYDPELGRLTWCCRRGRIRPGMVAGTLEARANGKGQLFSVRVNGKRYDAARVAWLFAFNEDPKECLIYCANGNVFDLRKSNLVKSRYALNCSTRKPDGHRGVSFSSDYSRRRKPWEAGITINDKKYGLGTFATQEEAIEARLKAEEIIEGLEAGEAIKKIQALRKARPTKRTGWGTCEVSGVHFDKNKNKWVAQLFLGGKRHYLGIFANKEEAIAARKKAEVELLGKAPTP